MPKEAIAGGTVLVFSKADPASNELIKAIVADLESGEGRASGPAQMRMRFSVHRYKQGVSQQTLMLSLNSNQIKER
jgi:hypothetical protein